MYNIVAEIQMKKIPKFLYSHKIFNAWNWWNITAMHEYYVAQVNMAPIIHVGL